MLKGNVQEKRGYLHTVISYKDENGVRKKKWQSTGLTSKGNIRKAEAILKERMEVLGCNVSEIRKLADHVQAILDDDAICVLGNEALMKKEEELFNTLEPLFQS